MIDAATCALSDLVVPVILARGGGRGRSLEVWTLNLCSADVVGGALLEERGGKGYVRAQ